MKASVLFRIAAVVFVLFAVGHTVGFLSFRPSSDQALAVRDAMNSVHFEAQGRIFSYGGWYRGFGLTATFAMLFEAFLAWHLGSMSKRRSPDVKPLGWAFFVWQLPGLALSYLYFGITPLIFSAAVAVLVAVATALARTQETIGV
jgi:hypothetical protein